MCQCLCIIITANLSYLQQQPYLSFHMSSYSIPPMLHGYHHQCQDVATVSQHHQEQTLVLQMEKQNKFLYLDTSTRSTCMCYVCTHTHARTHVLTHARTHAHTSKAKPSVAVLARSCLPLGHLCTTQVLIGVSVGRAGPVTRRRLYHVPRVKVWAPKVHLQSCTFNCCVRHGPLVFASPVNTKYPLMLQLGGLLPQLTPGHQVPI